MSNALGEILEMQQHRRDLIAAGFPDIENITDWCYYQCRIPEDEKDARAILDNLEFEVLNIEDQIANIRGSGIEPGTPIFNAKRAFKAQIYLYQKYLQGLERDHIQDLREKLISKDVEIERCKAALSLRNAELKEIGLKVQEHIQVNREKNIDLKAAELKLKNDILDAMDSIDASGTMREVMAEALKIEKEQRAKLSNRVNSLKDIVFRVLYAIATDDLEDIEFIVQHLGFVPGYIKRDRYWGLREFFPPEEEES